MPAFVPISAFLPRPSFSVARSSLSSSRIRPSRHRAARMEAAPAPSVDMATVAAKSYPATGVPSLNLAQVGNDAKFVVLYFYPRDCTSGCTVQAQSFTAAKSELDSLNTLVIGVSPDDIPSHQNFTDKESINFPLISDDGTLADSFSAWKTHPKFGKVINRSTFIIQNGQVVKEFRGVSAAGHVEIVLDALKELQK